MTVNKEFSGYSKEVTHINLQYVTVYTNLCKLELDKNFTREGEVGRKSHPSVKSYLSIDSWEERESQFSLTMLPR